MALTLSFGRPWVLENWVCSRCEGEAEGNFYMSNKRHDYGLCSKCQHEEPEDDLVYKIGRSPGTRPYQIHCIDCNKCGVSPIKGPRYQHKVKQNYNLCAECFSQSTSPQDGQAEEDSKLFDVLESTAIKSMCKSRQPVFHFHVRCNECDVYPVCGPVYKSVEDSDYDLCLTCFDSRLTKKKIEAADFKPIMRPEASQVFHVLIYACSHCNATPICGPAYVSQKNPSKTLCLLCFLSTTREKQSTYQRLEPPLEFDEETMDPAYGNNGSEAEAEAEEEAGEEEEEEEERGSEDEEKTDVQQTKEKKKKGKTTGGSEQEHGAKSRPRLKKKTTANKEKTLEEVLIEGMHAQRLNQVKLQGAMMTLNTVNMVNDALLGRHTGGYWSGYSLY